MNIYGIGTDIVNVNRIKNAIKKNKKAFTNKIYTSFEIKTCEKRVNKVECFAKRFAAKEALFKAVGIGNKLQFNDVEVRNNPSGAPKFLIKGVSLKNLKRRRRNMAIHDEILEAVETYTAESNNFDNNNVVLRGVNETLNKLEDKIDEKSGVVKKEVKIVDTPVMVVGSCAVASNVSVP